MRREHAPRSGWYPDPESRTALRWWEPGDIAVSEEVIFPADLPLHLPAILAGELPGTPLVLRG